MKRFFYKVKRKLANINQEAKIGVSIILVALIFFGGVGLTKKWWQPDTSMNSSSNMISSSRRGEATLLCCAACVTAAWRCDGRAAGAAYGIQKRDEFGKNIPIIIPYILPSRKRFQKDDTYALAYT